MKGVRATQSLELNADKENKGDVIVTILILKPIRYLTAYFLGRSSEFLTKNCPNAIFDLLSLNRSPAMVAIQFLTAVALGKARMLMLLYRYFGCDIPNLFDDNTHTSSDESTRSPVLATHQKFVPTMRQDARSEFEPTPSREKKDAHYYKGGAPPFAIHQMERTCGFRRI